VRIRDILREKGSDVITIRADRTVAEAVRVLNEHRIGSLLVTGAGGEPKGIVTERDLLHYVGDAWADPSVPDGTPAADRPVSALMTGDLVIAVPDDELDYVMGIMTQNRIRHLPVMDEGRLAGLISIGDVVRAQLHQHAYENRMLRDYIRSGDGAA
jgi:CBS domain-containing protein